MSDGGERFRSHPQPRRDLPDLPQPGAGECRNALMLAASTLLRARSLAPEDRQDDVEQIRGQIDRLVDQLSAEIEERSSDLEDGDPA